MIDSEDKPIAENGEISTGVDTEQTSSAPFSEPEKFAPTSAHGNDVDVNVDEQGGALGEYIGIGVKAIAVALSVVFLLLSILTVAMPLSAMRTFNRLGWSERALNSGDRYISRRIKDSDFTDALGNYYGFASVNLNDDDMIEAYDVCIGLSRKLMDSSAKAGDMASAKYFAQKLERYTRQYMSLGDIMTTNRTKSTLNVDNVPDIRMRPFVYDYAHTVMLDNFRARTYTGELNKMMYNGTSGDCVLETVTLANRYDGTTLGPGSSDAVRAQFIDGFVDYVGQLGEYLSVKFEALGIPASLSELDFIDSDDYQYILDGTDFELFITPTGGYTQVYKALKDDGIGGFTYYAQMAADFNATTIDDELHKLYWLQELNSVATKLWYMSMLLYYDKTASYGLYRNDIIEEYGINGNNGTCEMYRFVEYGAERELLVLSYVYSRNMQNYLAHFTV